MTSTNKDSFPNVMTIAGSDSSGGAGIQADLKTFAALKTYGTSAITAITAQNTKIISDIHPVPNNSIEAQIRALFDDIDIQAVKIGMLGNAKVIELVASLLAEYSPKYIVVDPVMISKSGNALLEDSAINALKTFLLPLATLITPNLPEAACLLNIPEASSSEEMHDNLHAIHSLGFDSILLKGGHLEGVYCQDMLLHDNKVHIFEHPKIATNNTHGTGCTLSSAITAYLSQGFDLVEAVQKSTDYVHNAITTDAKKVNVGEGHGPLSHFHHWW